MRTEKQREAARRNGAKSRGPVTTEGKARSSANSLRHGRYSRERAADNAALVAELYRAVNRFQPPSPPASSASSEQEAYLEATCLHWNARKVAAAAFQTAMLRLERLRLEPIYPDCEPDTLAMLAHRSLCQDSPILQICGTLEYSFAQECIHAFRRLLRFQSSRKKANSTKRTRGVTSNVLCPKTTFPENSGERTRQVDPRNSNTAPAPEQKSGERTQAAHAAGLPSKKEKSEERTRGTGTGRITCGRPRRPVRRPEPICRTGCSPGPLRTGCAAA